MKRSMALLVVAALVAGALLSTSSANAARITHRVSVGSPDADIFPPGTDANFSLIATQSADGTVRGQWHDQFGGGQFLHVEVNCLVVVGNEAWLSGTIKVASNDLAEFVGTTAFTRVRDNGTSANDPPDQISFTFFGNPPDLDCEDMLNLPLSDLNNGEVKVS